MSSEDPIIADLLVQWEESLEQGKTLTVEELCKDHPELIDQVRTKIQALEQMEKVVHVTSPNQVATLSENEAQAQSSSVALPTIPGYEILGVLGHGGMGVVYKAKHLALDRIIALKMILSGKQSSPRQHQRIRDEAEALARVSHPNIVQIYEVGEVDSCPYLCLEYVNGGCLSDVLSSEPHEPRQVAQMMETLARAVHAGHDAGVVHRDLKPANILLAHRSTAQQHPVEANENARTVSMMFENLTAWGSPKITDFGLAKRIDRTDGHTETQAIMGTPAYMAPEQASGHAKEAGPPADVYALGSIMYEMLTGQPPFVPREGADIFEEIKTKEPVPPRKLQPRVPRALQTICLTCLQKEPQKRYPSAKALAEDLEAYLTGDKIQAKPRGVFEHLLKFVQRHPVISVLTLGIVIATITLIAGGYVLALVISSIALSALVIGGSIYTRGLSRAFRQVAQQNQQIEQHADRLQVLLETTRSLLTANDLDALHLISQAATTLVNAERATIFLVDESKKELWSKIVLGPDVGEIRLPIGKGIAGTVAETGQIINIDDVYADPRFNQEIDKKTGYKTRNLLTFPMGLEEGRLLGVFQLVNKRDGAFTLQDISTLHALTSTATVVLQRMLFTPSSPDAQRNDPTQIDRMTTTEHIARNN